MSSDVNAPNWLDQSIQQVISTNDVQAIATAIAMSVPFLAAVQRGLGNPPIPGKMGASYAQNVATEIRKLFTQ